MTRYLLLFDSYGLVSLWGALRPGVLDTYSLGADPTENTPVSIVTVLLCASIFRENVFTESLLRNRLHKPIALLLRACMLQALPTNTLCLPSHCLPTVL
jgi:hypothetical protein